MIKPSLAVATEAYQLLLEKSRLHPEDTTLRVHKQQAFDLLDHLWEEYHNPVIARERIPEFL